MQLINFLELSNVKTRVKPLFIKLYKVYSICNVCKFQVYLCKTYLNKSVRDCRPRVQMQVQSSDIRCRFPSTTLQENKLFGSRNKCMKNKVSQPNYMAKPYDYE